MKTVIPIALIVVILMNCCRESGSEQIPISDLDRARIDALKFLLGHSRDQSLSGVNALVADVEIPEAIHSHFISKKITPEYLIASDLSPHPGWIFETKQIGRGNAGRYRFSWLGIRSDGSILFLGNADWGQLTRNSVALHLKDKKSGPLNGGVPIIPKK